MIAGCGFGYINQESVAIVLFLIIIKAHSGTTGHHGMVPGILFFGIL
jgi:hypothetical protein